MYRKGLWKAIVAGTLLLTMVLSPIETGSAVSAAEMETAGTETLTAMEETEDADVAETATEVTPDTAEADTEKATVNEVSTEETDIETEAPEADTATGDIPLTAKYFPDAKFRSYLSENVDVDRNKVLSKAERDAFTCIEITGEKITDLTGIEYFTELTYLDCNGNQLTSLNVSGSAELTYLDCGNNQLTSLNVRANKKLEELVCYWNELTNLDVSGNTALTRVVCSDNKLTNLNVRGDKYLKSLVCDSNELSSLNVSGNTKLTYLNCSDNKLTNLDVRANTELEILYCRGNELGSLNVRANTKLLTLDCNVTNLSSLDVRANTKLTYLNCDSNNLTSLDVRANTKLESLYCGNSLDYGNNNFSSLDVSANTELKNLDCKHNKLTELDVRANTKLTKLECNNNNLTSLDVKANTKLEYLGCSNNNLTSLDVKANTKLRVLFCSRNNLTSLDVKANTKLEYLDCSYNKLTSMDVSENTALKYFWYNDNNYCIREGSSQLDLSTLPGFDVSKVSNIRGGQISGTILTFNSGEKKVTYTYDCGNNHSTDFSISATLTANDLAKINEAFCSRLYTLCLGRSADQAGVDYWTAQLINGTQTGASVGYNFVFSKEYIEKNTSDEAFVKMLYEVFMNRSADQGGLNYWVDLLQQGVSREYVYKGFAESQEYTNICNSYGIVRGTVKLKQARDYNVNMTKYVSRIYEKALNRKGDADGLNYWCGQMQTKAKTPVQVAESFFFAPEFTNKNLSDAEYVKVLYRTFMGREYDQGGLDYWVARLNRGESRKSVLESFAGCQEFKNIVKSFGL